MLVFEVLRPAGKRGRIALSVERLVEAIKPMAPDTRSTYPAHHYNPKFPSGKGREA